MPRRTDLAPDQAASAAFARTVRAARPAPGTVHLWSLGGSGVLLKGGGLTVAIDPYLSNRLGDLEPQAPPGWRDRNAPPPVAADDLQGLDAILVTHGHGDHLDPDTIPALASASPAAIVVAPRAVRAALLDLAVAPERIRHPASDRPTGIGGWTLEAIPAAHVPPEAPVPRPDAAGGHDQVGYLVTIGRARVYHAGDTVVYDGLLERLSGRVDAAVLPVNGRRWSPLQPHRRGNMDFEEAADLAALCGARTVVPIHHELIGSSARPLEPFLEYARRVHPTLDVRPLAPGEVLAVAARQA